MRRQKDVARVALAAAFGLFAMLGPASGAIAASDIFADLSRMFRETRSDEPGREADLHLSRSWSEPKSGHDGRFDRGKPAVESDSLRAQANPHARRR
jgi:hypothetical protein